MYTPTEKFRKKRSAFLSLLIAMLAVVSACKEDDLPVEFPPFKPGGPDLVVYALTDDNQLIQFNAKNPDRILGSAAITGLKSGEKLLSIDFRPATGQLYAVSSNRLYVVNPATGAALAIGMEPLSPVLEGEIASLDFNPTVDRIRLITNTGQNLRLNPETGTVAMTDGAINGVNGAAITAAAYTNNVAGAASTTLYDIDATTQKLYKQDPPNDGTLVEVGPLNVYFTGAGGFDISPDNNAALAALTIEGKSGLYSIDLANGKGTKVGDFAATTQIIGIAIPTDAVAYAVDAMNNLLIFNPAKPEPVSKAIVGLQEGETVVGLDMRPVNGQLYALGSKGQLYTINAASGAALAVGTPISEPLVGTDFGFDFNPTVDRIRVVSDGGQNLRLNPNDGMLAAVDSTLRPGEPVVTAAAYTNNFAGATATTLYDIDTKTGILFKQDPPNAGVLVTVGSLGIPVDGKNGFDIGGTSNQAYALLTSNGAAAIYTIDLQTGAAKKVTDFPQTVQAMTLGLGF